MATLEEIFSYSKEKIENILELEPNILQIFIIYGLEENNYDLFRYKIAIKYFEEDNLLLYDKLLMYYFEEYHRYGNNTYYPTILRHDNPIDTIIEIKEKYNFANLKELISNKIGFVIGCGSTGCIIKPALNTFNSYFVSKVGFIKGITNEYKNIKVLPKDADMPFFDIDSVSFSLVDPIYHDSLKYKINLIRSVFDELNHYKKESKEVLENYLGETLEFNIYEIVMPYIKGETLHNIIQSRETGMEPKLKINDIFYNSLYPIVSIDLNDIIKLIKCLCKLYYQIDKLNNTYKIYHNDLHMRNIIYDEENNKITVIDFDRLSIGAEKKLEGRMGDIESILSHIQIFLLCGCIKNEYFTELLIDNNIITHFDINTEIFIDGLDFIKRLESLLYT
jgi:hypothetical protein